MTSRFKFHVRLNASRLNFRTRNYPSLSVDTAGDASIFFEAVPDFSVTAYTARICAIRIHEVGKALPCVYHGNQPNQTAPKETYTKTDPNRPFNDYATVEVGRTCPYKAPDAVTADNTFKASMYYELPPQAGITGGTFVLNSGLR